MYTCVLVSIRIHPIRYYCSYRCHGSSDMSVDRFVLQPLPPCGIYWRCVVEMRHVLKNLNLFWKRACSRLPLRVNNDYRWNLLFHFYRHIAWYINVHRFWMYPANMGALLNIHHYYSSTDVVFLLSSEQIQANQYAFTTHI